MTIDALRALCRTLAGTTEDIKWGSDLVFSVGGKMYAVVDLEPPHSLAFKTSPASFAELVERDGVIPAPYLARAMWVREQALGESFDRREVEHLVRSSYELVRAKLPKKAKAGTAPGTTSSRSKTARTKRTRTKASR
jgi:predicted DNA-binding protein (MmcQ/YjbR family)